MSDLDRRELTAIKWRDIATLIYASQDVLFSMTSEKSARCSGTHAQGITEESVRYLDGFHDAKDLPFLDFLADLRQFNKDDVS